MHFLQPMRSLDFPIALQIRGWPVLMVGAGQVAEARVRQLLAVGASVHVVAPEATPEIRALANAGALRWSPRRFEAGDCEGAKLVFSAVDDLGVTAQVAIEARARNILVNSADQPELCDFYMPSIGRSGAITIAVSTAGMAPGLARQIRERAMGAVPSGSARLTRLIGWLRRILPAGPARTAALRQIIEGGAGELVERRDRAALDRLLRGNLEPMLANRQRAKNPAP